MQVLIDRFPIVMVVGVVLIVGLSQVNRLMGSLLGVVFWLAMAAVGTMIYDLGGAVGIASVRFPLEGFLALCAALVLANVATGYRALKARKQATSEPSDQ